MGKDPAFQFYPGDWMQDTRALSLAAKGAWIDFLCAMWRSQSRGTLTLSWVGYSRLIGATVEQTKASIAELVETGICDAEISGEPATDESVRRFNDGNLTLINRRMVREARSRELANNRQKRYEARRATPPTDAQPDASLTHPSSSSSSSSDSSLRSESCAEPPKAESRALLKVPLKGGEEYEITQAQVDQWADVFPGVDVLAELKRLRQWNLDNPSKQKTRRGFPKHVSSWLGDKVDRTAKAGHAPSFNPLWDLPAHKEGKS